MQVSCVFTMVTLLLILIFVPTSLQVKELFIDIKQSLWQSYQESWTWRVLKTLLSPSASLAALALAMEQQLWSTQIQEEPTTTITTTTIDFNFSNKMKKKYHFIHMKSNVNKNKKDIKLKFVVYIILYNILSLICPFYNQLSGCFQSLPSLWRQKLYSCAITNWAALKDNGACFSEMETKRFFRWVRTSQNTFDSRPPVPR